MAVSFSMRLKMAMEDSKMTQAEVAKKSGYSACYICHICKGKVNNPRIETVYDLTRALNVSPAWLAGWTEVK